MTKLSKLELRVKIETLRKDVDRAAGIWRERLNDVQVAKMKCDAARDSYYKMRAELNDLLEQNAEKEA
jgi:hypothetical protein